MSDFIKIDEKTKSRIRQGIEENRKGDFEITFLDESNNPINADDVSIKFSKHDFEFGINIFMIDEFLEDWKNSIYKKKLCQIFNVATLPFYWNFNEPEEGKYRFDINCEKQYRRPSTDLCLKFCLENGLKPRLHGLAYERYFPDWLISLDSKTVKEKLDYRMKIIAERYKDLIELIEVTNEMHWDEGRTSYYKDPNYVINSFKSARKYFPNNKLIINEAFPQVWKIMSDDTLGVYFTDLSSALTKGASIDEIQFQFHMFFNDQNDYIANRKKFFKIDHLLEITDKYTEFGLPLGISEITIPSYLNNELTDEEQADAIEAIYSAWFSHKAVHHITYWNLVDGTAGGNYGDFASGENYHYGGLLRFDMSEKPAYKVLDRLINHEWTTNINNISVKNGKLSFRGFYGEYDILLKNRKYHVNLNPKNKQIIIHI